MKGIKLILILIGCSTVVSQNLRNGTALSSRRLQRRPRDRFPLIRRPRPLDRERRPRPYQPRDKTPRRPRPWNADGRPRIPRPDDSLGKTCEDGEQAARDLVHSYYQGDCNNVLNKDFHRRVKGEFGRNIGLKRREFDGNREYRKYTKCTSDALNRELEKVDQECSGSSAAGSDCDRLGEEVARLIVRRAGICRERVSVRRLPPPTAVFHRTCRRAMLNACEGFIREAAEHCGSIDIDVTQENELADNCRSKELVYELTGYEQPTTTAQTQSVVCTGGCSSDPYCAVTTNSTGSSKLSWRVFEQTNDPWHQDDDHEITIDVMHADKYPYYREGETEILLVKGTDYCLRIYKGDSSAYGSGTTSVKVSCFDEDEEETILAWMSMSGPTGQEHKQGVMCFRVTGTGGSDLIEHPFPKQPDIPSHGQPMDVVFAIDITDSMCKNDLAGLSWLDKTKDAVDEFLERMDTEASSSSMAGYVGWEWLNVNNRFKIKVLSEDIHDIKEGVAGLDCNNEMLKSHEEGMTTALRVFDSSTRPDSDPSSKAIIFITDDNDARRGFHDCVEGASRGVAIYTIGYETGGEEGDWLTQQAVCNGNGGFFRRSDGTSITTANIFDEIFDAINN